MDKKIGLDVDGVLCDFSYGVIARAQSMGLGEYFPKRSEDVDSWGMSPKFSEVMSKAWEDPVFWLSLPVLPYTGPLDFQPACYITSRPIASEITEKWLFSLNQFPEAPVITVHGRHEDKIQHCKDLGLDLFVDDRHDTVELMLAANIPAVLYAAPYHRGHPVKHLPRIQHLREIRGYVGL